MGTQIINCSCFAQLDKDISPILVFLEFVKMLRLMFIFLFFVCIFHATSKTAKTSPKKEINYSYQSSKVFFSVQSSTQAVYQTGDSIPTSAPRLLHLCFLIPLKYLTKFNMP